MRKIRYEDPSRLTAVCEPSSLSFRKATLLLQQEVLVDNLASGYEEKSDHTLGPSVTSVSALQMSSYSQKDYNSK